MHEAPGEGENSHRKGVPVGMLMVSLRGVNFGFWSDLGCSGQDAIIFSHKGLFKGCTRRNVKNVLFLGSKIGWATPRLVFFRGLI